MYLKALHSAAICDTQLNRFLSQNRNTNRDTKKKKLGPCQATEFKILNHAGSGEDGIVLQCRKRHDGASIAIKLFFQGQQPSPAYFWPLKLEALYYGSCAYYKAYFSDPSKLLPSLPVLPLAKWIQVNENELFSTISTDLSKATQEAAVRDQILLMLENMSAEGWVAFDMDIRNKLRQILPPGKNLQIFTGGMIIGIVKPFFKKEDWSIGDLERQVQTMVLMRSLGWKLRDVQDRNWINGYLVDGADVEIQPLYLRYLERSWNTAFFELIRQAKVQAGGKIVGDGSRVDKQAGPYAEL